jgi:mono/diheme cytochrome c family protein
MVLAGCQQQGGQSQQGGAMTASQKLERGRYLAAIMDCAGCHNRGSFSANPAEGYLQGGTVGFEVPGMAVFYPPNLTPDAPTGLGRWTEEEISTAVRQGRRPDGRMLAPAMPWHAYSALTAEDALALAAYLKSLPAAANQVPAPTQKESAPRPYLSVVAPAAK